MPCLLMTVFIVGIAFSPRALVDICLPPSDEVVESDWGIMRLTATGLLLALFTLLTVDFARTFGRGAYLYAFQNKKTDFGEFILSHSKPGDKILNFSPDPLIYPILLQTGRRPASRYLWDFILPFALQSAHFREHSLEMEEQIRRDAPALIFIRNTDGCQGCPMGLNLENYLKKQGFLDGPMAGYRPLASMSGYSIYGKGTSP